MNNEKHLFEAMQEARIAANAANRKASERKRRIEAGQHRIELWAHADDCKAIRMYAKKLANKRR